MNTNYHYHVIKTLALKAEFAPETAERIAFYSQMVDDFDVTTNLCKSINIKQEPPSYFFKARLAHKNKDGTYTFYPATTKIHAVPSVLKSTELVTLIPFHFISTKTIKELMKQTKRNPYRCLKASDLKGNELINLLWKEVNHPIRNLLDAMKMGMFLHTYADTYAHQGFSGFHGRENFSVIDKTTCKMTKFEKGFYFNLAGVGHANVGHLPDNALERFTYKRPSEGTDKPYREMVQRDNVADYQICSRRIFDLLCTINGQMTWNDQKWNALYERIMVVYKKVIDGSSEFTEAKALNPIWEEAFATEGYKYTYQDKMPKPIISPMVEQIDFEGLKAENLQEADLYDLFSEKGQKARDYAKITYNVGPDFFSYNELAYRRIKGVYGSMPLELLYIEDLDLSDDEEAAL